MGCAGSLTSYPGPKTTSAAAMCNSWDRMALHIIHLLFANNCDDWAYIVIFLSFSPNDGEIE
jgi:hypothetical protein